jgi:glutathione transport system substrate-binding protein
VRKQRESNVGVRVAASALAIGLALAGCGRASSGDASDAHRSSAPPTSSAPALVGSKGGTVTVALDQVPTTLNDHTVVGETASTRLLASLVWPQVFQSGPQQTSVLDTQVVQSAELVGTNPQTVVYQIDPKAVWSDGVPIDSSDFVYAWRSQRGGATDVDGKPDVVASTLGYRDIASVTGTNDGKTVTVVFKTTYGDWTSLFDDLLPAHVAQRVGWNNGFDTFDPTTLVSGGPFMVTSWQPGVGISLGRNPHWWGTAPHVDQIVVTSDSQPGTLTSALRSGAAQIAYPSDFDSSLLAALSSSHNLETTSSLGTTMLELVFNARHAPFDNVAARQGIAHSIARAGLVKDLVQPLNGEVWVDNDHLFSNTQPQYVNDGSSYLNPDPTAAQHLFAQAGLVSDPNGTWTSHGAPVTLQFVWARDDPWSALVEPAIATQLVDAGFDVTSVPVTAAQLTGTVLPSGGFDLAIAPIPASTYPSATVPYFSSAPTLANASGDVNWSGFEDQRLDALLTQAVQQLGSNQADPLYQRADQELWATMPTLPLYAEPTLLVNSAWINGVQDDSGGIGPMYYAQSWYWLIAGHT